MQVHRLLPENQIADADPSGLKPAFLRLLMTNESRKLVENVSTKFLLAQINHFYLPVTVNDLQYENSYVCSPYNGMITYSLEELKNIGSIPVRLGIRTLATIVAPLLKICKINRVVCVNNAMLSTNLYPNWKGEHLPELIGKLTKEFSHHAIMLRSLNAMTTPELCQVLEASEFLMVPSRIVYIIDPMDPSVATKRNIEIDTKLMRKSPYTVVQHHEFTDSDDDQIQRLYNQLYLDKYSQHNPQFTSEMIRLFRTTNQLQFLGLRDTAGKLIAVIATLELNQHFTTPIVGYDTSVPADAGLYRQLTYLVIQKSLREKKRFNMSSGVGKFKKHRGANPQVEYSAIYTKHLPRRQRMIWQTMAWLMRNIAAPLVQRYEL